MEILIIILAGSLGPFLGELYDRKHKFNELDKEPNENAQD